MPNSAYWPFDENKGIDDDGYKESFLLQKQLGDMEGEVKEIQMELAAIRKDRMDIFNKQTKTSVNNSANENVDSPEECKSQKHIKITEIEKLREELLRARQLAEEERNQREKQEEKLMSLDHQLEEIYTKEIKKDSQGDSEDTLKIQVRDLREEVEELKISLTHKSEQLQDYRMKYLQAQQEAVELRRQLDIVDFDNKQVSDQIQIEIQKMKMQFQEKLQELSPLPDLLKGAQIQLQEARQLQKLAEESSQQLSNELQRVKDKLVVAVNGLGQEKLEKNKLLEEAKKMRAALDEKQAKIKNLSSFMDETKCKVMRLEEKLNQQELRYKEKATEATQLAKDLEDSRNESNRTLSRCKERANSARQYMQNQISELERQLIQSRAQHKACQKERDEIRQRLQMQISNLQENFELVEIRLRGLQGQVASLKQSYTVILASDDEDSDMKVVHSSA